MGSGFLAGLLHHPGTTTTKPHTPTTAKRAKNRKTLTGLLLAVAFLASTIAVLHRYLRPSMMR